MDIGDTLRFFRTQSNYTQKEMLPNHSDPSTYSRIENNKRPARLTDIKDILEKLSITSEEFFSFSEIDNKQEEFSKLYYYCGSHLDNSFKKKKLISYYNELSNNQNKNLKELSNYIAIKNYFYEHWIEIDEVTTEELNDIYNYLINKKVFFQYDYILISNLIPHFSTKQSDIIISKAIPIPFEEKRDHLTKKFAYNALINLISIRLHDKDYERAGRYIRLAKKQDKSNNNYSYRMNLQYLSNLLSYLEKGEPIYMEHIYDFIHILEDIGDYTHASNIKKELKSLTHNTGATENHRYYPIAMIKKD